MPDFKFMILVPGTILFSAAVIFVNVGSSFTKRNKQQGNAWRKSRNSIQLDKADRKKSTFRQPESHLLRCASREADAVATEVWRNLNRESPTLCEDSAFWWQTLGSTLSQMLQAAGYTPREEEVALLFHRNLIVPSLGPWPTEQGRPKQWKSFVTDDFSPFEFSWSFGTGESTPKVRFVAEPISKIAGTSQDPLNLEASRDLRNRLKEQSPKIDWQWYDHMMTTLAVTPEIAKAGTPQPDFLGHRSSVLFGFDLDWGNVNVKPYVIPDLKAVQGGISRFQVISRGLRSATHLGIDLPALDALEDFVTHDPKGSRLEFPAIAPDCIDPKKSRLKIYGRSAGTSFDTVRAIMTLGGQLQDPALLVSLNNIWELWRLVLSLPSDFPTSESLVANNGTHPTCGILYNFDIKPGNVTPETKVYIPVKHYATNDAAVLQGLATFLRSRGRVAYVDEYVRAVEKMCRHRDLAERAGLHTYIGCGLKGGKLDLSSYLSPEIYAPGRWS
ncbi:hypothetical protein MMC25_006770 [Agyrium rufum]|nr:hypothetical protein [Agyrium rufum]